MTEVPARWLRLRSYGRVTAPAASALRQRSTIRSEDPRSPGDRKLVELYLKLKASGAPHLRVPSASRAFGFSSDVTLAQRYLTLKTRR